MDGEYGQCQYDSVIVPICQGVCGGLCADMYRYVVRQLVPLDSECCTIDTYH